MYSMYSTKCIPLNTAGGVSILIDSKSENTLAEAVKWNDRILIVIFKGKPKTTIIIQYSPCEGSPNAKNTVSN